VAGKASAHLIKAHLNKLGSVVYPRQRSDITRQTIDGEVVILDRRSQKIHQLNEAGSFIWDKCDGATPVSEIVRSVTERFDVEHDVAMADVERAVEELRSLDLLVVDNH